MKRIKQIQKEIETLTKLLKGESKSNLWMQGKDRSFIEGENVPYSIHQYSSVPFIMLQIDP